MGLLVGDTHGRLVRVNRSSMRVTVGEQKNEIMSENDTITGFIYQGLKVCAIVLVPLCLYMLL